MKNRALAYSGWVQVILAITAVFALRWENPNYTLGEFFQEFWWVWPAVLALVVMGASTIIRNRR
jgi:hypothetical protein